MNQLEDTLYIVKTYYNIKKLAENTSNDMELGEAIRKELAKEVVDGTPKYKSVDNTNKKA